MWWAAHKFGEREDGSGLKSGIRVPKQSETEREKQESGIKMQNYDDDDDEEEEEDGNDDDEEEEKDGNDDDDEEEEKDGNDDDDEEEEKDGNDDDDEEEEERRRRRWWRWDTNILGCAQIHTNNGPKKLRILDDEVIRASWAASRKSSSS